MAKSKGNPLKVHSKVHFFMKHYSIGFYTGGGNIKEWNFLNKKERDKKLSKAWYVYWSYRHPVTGKLTRQEPNIKIGVNKHHNKKDRMKALNEIKKELIDLFESGFSPYRTPEKEITISIEYAFDKALNDKKKYIKPTTYKDYKSRIETFKTFLMDNKILFVSQINKNITSIFLNQYSPKNSNNFRAALSSLFSVLSDQGFIEFNFIKELRPKQVRKKGIKIYNEKEIENITLLLEKEDKELLMFIKLISYMFWRPIEIVQIKIKNIDFKNNIINVDTKRKDSKTKIIPEIIREDLREFIGDREYLFNLTAKTNSAKRDVLTKRFARFRERNKISKDFKMYSFRHTFITKLYRELRKGYSKEETIKQLSLITGHESKAINNYIMVNDLELPEDYSKMLRNNISSF